MLKSELVRAIQKEIRRHNFDTFVDEPPSMAQGGRGVVVTGCSLCKVQFYTTVQFMDHVADSIPALLDKLSTPN